MTVPGTIKNAIQVLQKKLGVMKYQRSKVSAKNFKLNFLFPFSQTRSLCTPLAFFLDDVLVFLPSAMNSIGLWLQKFKQQITFRPG